MNCTKCKTLFPDLLLDPRSVSSAAANDAHRHIKSCSACLTEWTELQAVMQNLEMWNVPEPSPYFETRLSARLREEKASPAPGFFERLGMRLQFGSRLQLRPAMAAAAALLLVSGFGSYEGMVSLNRTPPPAASLSATVTDLEILDANAKTLQQFAAFDDPDGAMPASSGATN